MSPTEPRPVSGGRCCSIHRPADRRASDSRVTSLPAAPKASRTSRCWAKPTDGAGDCAVRRELTDESDKSDRSDRSATGRVAAASRCAGGHAMRCSTALIAVLSAIVWSSATAQAPGQWNVVTAGAVGDGVTDCTEVFQKTLDEAAKAGGGVVNVPAGRFCIKGNLSIPACVTLQGTYRMPPTIRRPVAEEIGGTVLLAYAGRGSIDGPPFIRLAGNCSAVAGVVVLYPEWKQTDVPPVPYPPCILSQGTENVAVQDCLLVNPYEGIVFIAAHRHLVRNVTGYPIKRGLYVDQCYDIGHIENIHYWPFGVNYKPDDPYCLWINTKGVAFELARTDWHYVSNTFCFGYGVGYKFSESKAGSTNGNFLGLGADSCRRAVLVEQAQDPGLLITNGEFVGRWGSTDSVCVEVGPKAVGKVSLVNCSFWGPIERCVWMRSPLGSFSANACHFVHWNNTGSGAPALDIEAGAANIANCTFGNMGTHVRLGSKVRSAIVMGNQAADGIIVKNAAGKRAQMLANEEDPVQWTPEARLHYRVVLGEEGDARLVEAVHGREHPKVNGRVKSHRWSMAESRLILPVRPERSYTISVAITVPAAALAPDAGLYLGKEKIASITKAGPTTLTARIPAQTGETVTVSVRCKGWVPSKVIPSNADGRTLGVQLHSVTMRAAR
ncbi:MAG: hypothetical protein FJX72_16685, partial [Armatimonadetes bacterium]|nr:hypothetical protein [Armatimonadota bacterium]